MRGLYTANVLNTLAERFAEKNRDGADFDIGRNFDLIVGASTGAFSPAASRPASRAKSYRAFTNFMDRRFSAIRCPLLLR